MNFKELEKHKTIIDNFSLKWRFDSTNKPDWLNNSIILNKEGCDKVSAYLNSKELYSDFPFKKEMFSKNVHFSISEKNDNEIKSMLDSFGFDDNYQILLTWNDETAMLTNWSYFANHHSELFYLCSDDLTVFGESMLWVILFHHSETVYHSSNNLKPIFQT